jgi:hypothetical protein
MNRIDRAELDAIRTRLDAATPGPWTPSSHCCSMGLYPVGPSHEFSERYDGPRLKADVFFIAHAPTDLRALLDEVERLMAREASLVKQTVAQMGVIGRQQEELEVLKNERPFIPADDAQLLYTTGYEDGEKQTTARLSKDDR